MRSAKFFMKVGYTGHCNHQLHNKPIRRLEYGN